MLLAAARVAQGEPRFVSLELDVDPLDEPQVVCVLGEAAGRPIADCAAGSLDPRGGVELPNGIKSNLGACEAALAGAKKGPEDPWEPVDLGGQKLFCALNSGIPASVGARPADHGAANGPAVKKAEKSSARILILRLVRGPVAEGAKPLVDGISVHGRDVALRISSVGSGDASAAAHIGIAGGHYAAGAAVVSIHDHEHIQLPLVPMEMHRGLKLPPSRDTQTYPKCENLCTVTPDRRRVVLEREGVTERPPWIHVEGGDFAADAEWWSNAPPEVIEPLVSRIDFSWKRPLCLRDLSTPDDCPQASLPSVPSTCQKPSLDASKSVCNYSCSASVPKGVHSGFSLPTTVDFQFNASASTSSPPDSAAPTRAPGSFSASLAYAGQVIGGDVNERQRDVLVRFEGWPLEQEVGKRIHHVSLLERDGRALSVVPRAGLVLAPFPGLSCDDQVQYDLVGDLDYKTWVAQVGQTPKGQTQCPAGALCLETPRTLLDEPVTLGFAGAGGGYYPIGGGTPAGVSTNQAIGARWMASLEAIGRLNRWWPPRGWRFPWRAPVLGDWLEGRLGLITSFRWANGLQRDEPGPSGQQVSVSNSYTYIRIDGILHLTWSIMHRWYLGLGGGLLYGRPLHNSDQPFAPIGVSWIPGSAVIGFRSTSRIAIEARILVAHEAEVTSALSSLGSQPTVSSRETWGAFYAMGLRFDL